MPASPIPSRFVGFCGEHRKTYAKDWQHIHHIAYAEIRYRLLLHLLYGHTKTPTHPYYMYRCIPSNTHLGKVCHPRAPHGNRTNKICLVSFASAVSEPSTHDAVCSAQDSHLLKAVVDLLFLVQVAESTNAPLLTPVKSLVEWGM